MLEGSSDGTTSQEVVQENVRVLPDGEVVTRQYGLGREP